MSETKNKIYIFFLAMFLSLFMSFPVFAKASTIKVKVGADFNIELESNPTTGYQWALAKATDSKFVKLVSSEYFPKNTNLTGAGGKEIWVFEAIKKGETKISFKYVRPWETSKPAQQRVYVIEINGK